MTIPPAAPTLDDDVRQLCETLRAMLGTANASERAEADAEWRHRWEEFAALGVTALCVPERLGGFGLHVPAAVATAMEFGRALHASPFAGITAGAHALAEVDSPTATDALADIVSGRRVIAFGRSGPSGDIAHLVDGAAEANALVVSIHAQNRIVLLTDRSTWRLGDPTTFDLSRSCVDVHVDLDRGFDMGPVGIAQELFGLLLAADGVGGVQRMLDDTVDYAREREAFGKPIGGFQAVQHRLADHAVRVRGMTLAVEQAARLLAAGAEDAARFVAMAELSVSSNATHILHDLVQLCGGIGFTWEHGLHRFERRAHHNARLVGNPRAAARKLADEEGWSDER